MEKENGEGEWRRRMEDRGWGIEDTPCVGQVFTAYVCVGKVSMCWMRVPMSFRLQLRPYHIVRCVALS